MSRTSGCGFLLTSLLLALTADNAQDPKADQQQSASHVQELIAECLADLSLVPRDETISIEDPLDYFPLRPVELRYRTVNGKGEEGVQKVTIRRGRHHEDEGTAKWKRQHGKRCSDLIVMKEGDLVQISEHDSRENVITFFNPPQMVIPREFKSGESRSSEVAAKVVDDSDPDSVQHRGKLVQTLTCHGSYEVVVPAGTFEGVLISSHLKGKIGPAKVESWSCAIYVKDIGPVAAVFKERLSAFLIYDEDTSLGRVLLEAPVEEEPE